MPDKDGAESASNKKYMES